MNMIQSGQNKTRTKEGAHAGACDTKECKCMCMNDDMM